MEEQGGGTIKETVGDSQEEVNPSGASASCELGQTDSNKGNNSDGGPKPVENEIKLEEEVGAGIVVEEEYCDPRVLDYDADVGICEEDLKGFGDAFKEKRTKDVPCKFHNGFSGRCWKGSACVYGHEQYTGGVFASNHPELALARESSRGVTSMMDLPHKPVLNTERDVYCRVTHVVSPGEFFIRPVEEGQECPCHKLDVQIAQMKKTEERKEKEENAFVEDLMESYFYGFRGLEGPHEQGLQDSTESPAIFVPASDEEKLNGYLSTAFNYKKFQYPSYINMTELVAVRIDGRWMRAVVLNCPEIDFTSQLQSIFIRVQLLDTGEKTSVASKDVCRLPSRYAGSHPAAFRCMTFRVSPIWFVWAQPATKIFKELVENKVIRVIVKDGICNSEGVIAIFESEPYQVKVLVDEKGDGERWTDVAQILIDSGYALEWNLMPYRPGGNLVMNTKGLDFFYTPGPATLHESTLDTENKRLVWNKFDEIHGLPKEVIDERTPSEIEWDPFVYQMRKYEKEAEEALYQRVKKWTVDNSKIPSGSLWKNGPITRIRRVPDNGNSEANLNSEVEEEETTSASTGET